MILSRYCLKFSQLSQVQNGHSPPAKGQCRVVALVEILKIRMSEDWHFYNRINGECYDLIESQFSQSIQYGNTRIQTFY
ncbi:YunG family protein [Thermaerobacillus caldiproteolyticus]